MFKVSQTVWLTIVALITEKLSLITPFFGQVVELLIVIFLNIWPPTVPGPVIFAEYVLVVAVVSKLVKLVDPAQKVVVEELKLFVIPLVRYWPPPVCPVVDVCINIGGDDKYVPPEIFVVWTISKVIVLFAGKGGWMLISQSNVVWLNDDVWVICGVEGEKFKVIW